MKALSSILGGVLLIIITMSAMTSIALLHRNISESIDSKVNYYNALLAQNHLSDRFFKEERSNGLIINGDGLADLKYLLIINKRETVVLSPSQLISDSGELLIPRDHLVEVEKIYLITNNNAVIDIDWIKSVYSLNQVNVNEMDNDLFNYLLSRSLNLSDVYKLMEEPIATGTPVIVDAYLPLTVSIKVENTSYIIETTTVGCAYGYSKVLYWGASTDYLINVTLNYDVFYYDRGNIQFVYTGVGSFSTFKSFPSLTGSSPIIVGDGSLVLNFSLSSYIELIASSPSPVGYCTNSFYFSQPTIGFNARVNITLAVPNSTKAITIVPEMPSIWVKKPTYYSETKNLYGYYLYNDPLYIYMKNNVVLGFYSHIYGTSTNRGEISINYPKIRLTYSLIN